MIEIPKGSPQFRLQTGQEIPGFQCKKCCSGIAIGGDPETLPPSFQLRCPTCQEIETYQLEKFKLWWCN